MTKELDDWLELKFREYYTGVTDFFVGADDNDCLTLNADFADSSMTWTQTQENRDESDAEYFVFQSDETMRIMTIPFAPEEPENNSCGVHPIISGKEG